MMRVVVVLVMVMGTTVSIAGRQGLGMRHMCEVFSPSRVLSDAFDGRHYAPKRLRYQASQLESGRPDSQATDLPDEELTYGRAYRVTEGDTLSEIAATYGTSVNALQLANDMGRSTRIQVGQTLRIPTAINVRVLETTVQTLQAELASLEAQIVRDREDRDVAEAQFRDDVQAMGNLGPEAVGRFEAQVGHTGTQLWWLLGGLAAVFFSGMLGFRALARRNSVHAAELSAYAEAQETMRAESIQLDTKLTELLEHQLQMTSREPEAPSTSEEVDHTLSLRVADELVRMEKNFSQMPEDIRGLKQLKAAAKRIKDSLEVKGYEVVDLLGQRYRDGMKLITSAREDDTLPVGQEIITRIIKPPVNYQGKMIQAGQVEVSVGTKEPS